MRKIILNLLFIASLCLSATVGARAQSAKDVLDQAYSHLSASGGISVKFTAISLVGKEEQGSTSGNMKLEGKKFHAETNAMLVWFDGRSQWSMRPGDKEVNLTEPTLLEQQTSNPYVMLQTYRNRDDYKYKLKQGTLSNGKQGYKIFMSAQGKGLDIREIFVEIDNKYSLVRLSFRQGKENWTRLVIDSMQTGQEFTDADFTFPTADYPNVQVVDLK